MTIWDYIFLTILTVFFGTFVSAAASQTVRCWLGMDTFELVWDYEREGLMCRHCGYFEC